MKILLIVAFSLFAQFTIAQTSSTPYYKEPDLKKFAGEWRAILHDSTLIIDLKFVKRYIAKADLYIDVLQGDYKLLKGNQILQSTSNDTGIAVGSFINKNESQNKIKFLFYDSGKNSKSGRVTFELLNDLPNKATWILTNQEGVHIGYYDYSFSVPTMAVFKKVN